MLLAAVSNNLSCQQLAGPKASQKFSGANLVSSSALLSPGVLVSHAYMEALLADAEA